MDHSLETKKTKNWLNYLKIAKNPGKVPELDGLRAMAILLVVFHHFATFYQEYHHSFFKKAVPEFLQQLMFNGWLGVDLFFVLSGYLIFHHLSTSYQQSNQQSGFGRYALKRVLRTFPLYFAMISLIVLGLIPYYKANFTSTDVLIHLVFLQDYFGANLLTPMWSLATEEKFYLLAPLLLFLTRLSIKKSVGMLLLLIIIFTLYRSMMIQQHTEPLNAISFFEQFRAPFHYAITSILVGVMTALLCQQQKYRYLPWLFALSILLTLALLNFTNLYRAGNWQVLNVLHLLLVMLFGLMVWTAVKFSGAWWLKWLTGRFLRIIAVMSYAWYLAHYTVLPWVYRLHKHHIYSEEPWIHALSFLGMYLALSLIFTLLLHYLIEKPFLLWKDRL